MKSAHLIGIGILAISSSTWAGTSYTTMAASNITATTATLNGNALSTIGLSGEIFDYGTTTQYGSSASASPQGVNGPVSANISGLQCNTTYHFRFRGDPKPPRTTNQGSDMTFKTGAGDGVLAGNYSVPPRNFSCTATMQALPDGQMFWAIREGVTGTAMPAHAQLSDEEVWLLVAYVRLLGR